MKPLEDLGELQQIAFDNACIRCQYCVDKKCWNKTNCFWFDKANKLKALEIIATKKVDVGMLSFHDFNYYDYNFLVAEDKRQLTQEEIDLLKEVLL